MPYEHALSRSVHPKVGLSFSCENWQTSQKLDWIRSLPIASAQWSWRTLQDVWFLPAH